MSDHAMLGLIMVVGFVVQLMGLVILALQLREARREAHRDATVLGALVVQESDRVRALFGAR